MHSQNYKKAVCLFFTPAFIFLDLILLLDATALVFGLFAHSKESAFILKSLVTGCGGL